MAKRKKRRAFPVEEGSSPVRRESYSDLAEVVDADEPGFGVFGWFRNPGVRETIESIVIAILLAFMFKTYEAEAFVIPTGSMAPSLQGEHMDLACAQCGYQHIAGASSGLIEKTRCPICAFQTRLRPSDEADHRPNSGDRILVNKFIYDFNEPERFDVIVFKYPNNAKQNYIKRLIGLPGDNILIENGDVYLMEGDDNQGWSKEIARKPSRKVKQVLMDVDDTNYISGKMRMMKWPSRWAQWDGGSGWTKDPNEEKFSIASTGDVNWLRYRHLTPTQSDWLTVLNAGKLPEEYDKPVSELPAGSLVSDAMSYNEGTYLNQQLYTMGRKRPTGFGQHWVGDLGVEMWADIESSTGELLLDLVEGGVHFTCRFDIATGKATLECKDSRVDFHDASGAAVKSPVGETSLSSGSNRVLMVNADDQIHLWVNGSLVDFDAATYRRDGVPIPTYSPEEPGDAEPAGVGAKNLSMTVTRLKIVRDVYYSSVKREEDGSGANANESRIPAKTIHEIMTSPETWGGDNAMRYFVAKKQHVRPMFTLQYGETREKDQFFPMGDNSTQSLDARVWPRPDHFVERDMLIGRAIYVYWPHTLNEPIPFFPNFGKMKFIR